MDHLRVCDLLKGRCHVVKWLFFSMLINLRVDQRDVVEAFQVALVCACTRTHTKTNSFVRKFLCLLWASRISRSVIDVEGVIATWDHSYRSQSLSCRKKVKSFRDGFPWYKKYKYCWNDLVLIVCMSWRGQKVPFALAFLLGKRKAMKKVISKAYLFGGRKRIWCVAKKAGKRCRVLKGGERIHATKHLL